MKLNRNCIIDILKYLEENCKVVIGDGKLGIPYGKLKEDLSQHEEITLLYNLDYLITRNYVFGNINQNKICEEFYNADNDNPITINFNGIDYLHTLV